MKAYKNQNAADARAVLIKNINSRKEKLKNLTQDLLSSLLE
jgi:hypothetical protein